MTQHILNTLPGIELRLVLLPRRLALIEFVPFDPPSFSFSTCLCVAISNDPYSWSASVGKCFRKLQYALKLENRINYLAK